MAKVDHQPKPKPQASSSLAADEPDFTPSRANPKLDLRSPARVGKELYHIEPRDTQDPTVVSALAARLEDMVAPGDLYTCVMTAGVCFWRAFLTVSEYVSLGDVPEVSKLIKPPTAHLPLVACFWIMLNQY